MKISTTLSICSCLLVISGVLTDASANQLAAKEAGRSTVINARGENIAAGAVKIRKAPAVSFETRRRLPSAATGSGIIYAAPEGGTTKVYGGAGQSVMWMGDMAALMPTDGAAQELTTYENGDVYWKDPIFGLPTSTYLKGKLADGKFSLALPQPILEMEGETYYVYSLKMEDVDGVSWFVPDTDNTSISLALDSETGVLTQEGDNMLGICNRAGDWQLVGQIEMVLTPFAKTVTYMPEDAGAEDWAFRYTVNDGNEGADVVKVGRKDDKLYISGLYPFDKDACITAEIQGDKIYWESEQYFGNYGGYFFYVYGGHKEVETYVDEDDVYHIEESIYYEDDATMAYDAEAKTISPIQDGQLIMVSSGMTWPLVQYEELSFKYQGEVTDFTPAAPRILDYYDFDTELGMIVLTLPIENVQGQVINSENISYEVYVNDALLTFSPDAYTAFEKPMTRIPYGFTDNNDITGLGATRNIMLHQDGIESLGVVCYYQLPDGSELASERATFAVAGISDATSESPVAGTEYFDLSGRAVKAPAAGIYIKADTRADGSRAVSKVVVR